LFFAAAILIEPICPSLPLMSSSYFDYASRGRNKLFLVSCLAVALVVEDTNTMVLAIEDLNENKTTPRKNRNKKVSLRFHSSFFFSLLSKMPGSVMTPISNIERWVDIWKFNTGGYDYLLSHYSQGVHRL
jgi:hypothetical protein